MSIKIKTAEEIERMHCGQAGRRNSRNDRTTYSSGVTTDELNKICHEYALEKAHTLHRLITMVSLSRFVRLSTILFVTEFLLKRRDW